MAIEDIDTKWHYIKLGKLFGSAFIGRAILPLKYKLTFVVMTKIMYITKKNT